MKKLLTLVIAGLLLVPAFGQQPSADALVKQFTGRSEKIAQSLGITDSIQYKRVVDQIVKQLVVAWALHDAADSTIRALRNSGLDKEALGVQIRAFQNERDARLYNQHVVFAAQLQGELTAEQIEVVKNGLTDNLMNTALKALLEKFPTLKDDEKRQTRTWLLEAREHAIDAATSDSRNGWFGQCKGRINNYLTAKGYNLNRKI